LPMNNHHEDLSFRKIGGVKKVRRRLLWELKTELKGHSKQI